MVYFFCYQYMVAVAQLAEHLTVDQTVVGSSPIGHPLKL